MMNLDTIDAAAPMLLKACLAALKYDEAIQAKATDGKPWVESDSLDALYADWISKAREALNIAMPDTREPTYTPLSGAMLDNLMAADLAPSQSKDLVPGTLGIFGDDGKWEPIEALGWRLKAIRPGEGDVCSRCGYTESSTEQVVRFKNGSTLRFTPTAPGEAPMKGATD